jgi:hypothetical protein
MMGAELKIAYDPNSTPIGAACTLCGEQMPMPTRHLSTSKEVIIALSIEFSQHIENKHRMAEACSPRRMDFSQSNRSASDLNGA